MVVCFVNIWNSGLLWWSVLFTSEQWTAMVVCFVNIWNSGLLRWSVNIWNSGLPRRSVNIWNSGLPWWSVLLTSETVDCQGGLLTSETVDCQGGLLTSETVHCQGGLLTSETVDCQDGHSRPPVSWTLSPRQKHICELVGWLAAPKSISVPDQLRQLYGCHTVTSCRSNTLSHHVSASWLRANQS